MTNGIIMCGKTTTSRSGTIGRVSYTSNGFHRYLRLDFDESADYRLQA